MLLDLVPLCAQQPSLFAAVQTERGRPQVLMRALDDINARYGRRTVQFAAEGVARSWQMRRDRLSPRYTTRWDELPAVLAR